MHFNAIWSVLYIRIKTKTNCLRKVFLFAETPNKSTLSLNKRLHNSKNDSLGLCLRTARAISPEKKLKGSIDRILCLMLAHVQCHGIVPHFFLLTSFPENISWTYFLESHVHRFNLFYRAAPL